MKCQCGETFTEVYHPDWPTLCIDCARIELKEHNRAWSKWFETLTLDQKIDYYANGPYTLQQVKDFIFNF
jgi:hypothetical protein